MRTYHQVLKKAQQEMERKGYGEQSALVYMVELTNKDAHNLYMEMDQEMAETEVATYEAGMQRLLAGEPLGHVLGFEWFYGYRFTVNEDVFIPRPETEELVANILAGYDEYFINKENVIAVDVGTGSGAIAIALKKEESNIHMLASDISEKALHVAKQNAIDNQVTMSFLLGDMLQPFVDRDIKVDILISNPPYIPQEETMEESVVKYEPHVALFGGDDGLKYYRRIFEQAPNILQDQAMLAFEMGYNQKKEMKLLVEEFFPTARCEIIKDMSGKDRMVFIYINL